MRQSDGFERCLPADVELLFADVAERLALRDPGGEWHVTHDDAAVRLWRKTDGGHLSRYVWRAADTDAVIDHLSRS